MTRKIIIDTDPGIDDAMAIYYALGCPELDVIGLTTVYGNVRTPLATANAQIMLDVAGRPDIPVAEGAHGPLSGGVFDEPPAFVHGHDGFGDGGPAPTGDGGSAQVVAAGAAEFIVEAVRAAPGEITLVPLGPLTNIARAAELEPRLAELLAGIVLMGGAAFTGGNATPAAEANIVKDPEAADVVFGLDCPIVMAGLDVTESTRMTADDLNRFADLPGRRAAHVARMVPYYQAYHASIGLEGSINVHDPSTISYLIAPDAFEWVEHPVRVDTGTSVARGATVPAVRRQQRWEPWADRPDVRILLRADVRRVVELQLERTAD